MFYSKRCKHALRALVYLATLGDGRVATAQEISERENLPRPSLAGVLNELARTGLVMSYKGPRGGFALAFDPQHITLYDVVARMDGPLDFDQCLTRLQQCDGAGTCLLPEGCKAVRASIRNYLMRNNVYSLRVALEQSQALLAEAASLPLIEVAQVETGADG